MSAHPVPAWDGRDLRELLELQPVAPGRFRTCRGDANANQRAYGGQILAQALAAAARTVPDGRTATAMQFLFLQGTRYEEAVTLDVAALQDGKRFSSRHVRGSQSDRRLVLDAQVSFAVPMTAPRHSAPPAMTLEDPEALPPVDELPARWSQAVRRAFGYELAVRNVLDFRLPDPPKSLRLQAPAPHLRFWVRVRDTLADDPHLHAAAFAYLSDWWLNYPAMGAHQDEAVEAGGLYVASLNHAIWLHEPFRADEWLHFDSTSPAAANGRGLCVARVHDRAGRLVASATQECVMGLRP